MALRGFGEVGLEWFTARKTFDAVLGNGEGWLIGGGGELRYKDRFLFRAEVEHFRRSGQRVFVYNGTVYNLGIADEVSITPLLATIGYRFRRRPGQLTPYVGGGIGRYFYSETSPIADATENIDMQPVGYHLLGGVEKRVRRLLFVAGEVQYASVPHALTGGAAGLFGERDLGGLEARVRVLIGR
jgi:hypothetical protein